MKKKREQSKARPRAWTKIALVMLGLGVAGGLYWTIRGPEQAGPPLIASRTEPTSNPSLQLPPFYESEEAARPFPVTLSPAYFRYAYVSRAYRVAQQIPGVLAQQPCYCYCDKFGHRGLLDCYASDHGAG